MSTCNDARSERIMLHTDFYHKRVSGAAIIFVSLYFQNVVVVNQPASQPAVVVEEEVNTPNDHLLFTICTLIFCCLLGNWIALICLIPALCLSLAVSALSIYM